jgi:LysR family hydrogen peroxide-inducible transcriptional activator
MILLVVLAAQAGASANPEAAPAKPISVHPQNPKYFLFRGKPVALIAATEHYGSVINSRFDFERYLHDAADKGQTVTRLFLLFRERKGELAGELKLGIIPTLAPYLLPLFLDGFLKRYPNIRLTVTELTTEMIVDRLKKSLLDAGLLVTPLDEPGMTEHPLFHEEFVVYVSPEEAAYKKRYVLAADIDIRRLWLLEEGHCMRSQIMQLCELKTKGDGGAQFHYEAGSIETLKKMVEMRNGVTILPELALNDMTATQMKMVRHFKPPAPVREVSLVTHRNFVKQKMLAALRDEVLRSVPETMKKRPGMSVVGVGSK